mgnify:CR=1 FL=1
MQHAISLLLRLYRVEPVRVCGLRVRRVHQTIYEGFLQHMSNCAIYIYI